MIEDNTNLLKEKIEQRLLQSWVQDKIELLNPYYSDLDVRNSKPTYFRWALSPEAALVWFKPRNISMVAMISWLALEDVIDIQICSNSQYSQANLGSTIQEVLIVFKPFETESHS